MNIISGVFPCSKLPDISRTLAASKKLFDSRLLSVSEI
ncbi:hypothetical protein MmTuc01_0734 [Methanosarcina mazei Tuc01]|uniref:Uncharacterized protein n=1 Tax=Methanosarcina mazei Tuc01 TaxID=1236903 RepID=M1P6V3_METMZ|nr:hypothetical protein MmTuc01_0734 [Methanosarcina mazei Tuc01]